METAIARAVASLRRARDVVVVTGAGVSAASGIDTYRSDGRRWDDQDLAERMDAGVYLQHLPVLWEHWHAQREQVAAAAPNPAHRALAEWERQLEAVGGRLTVVTQNVDDLHERAGSRTVEHLHGRLQQVRCVGDDCGVEAELGNRDADGVPRCPACGAPQRPDVVLFAERLDPLVHHRSKSAVRWCDGLVYVGTSGAVRPASHLHEHAPSETPLILINRDPWVDGGDRVFDEVVLGRAEEQLPSLVAQLARPLGA